MRVPANRQVDRLEFPARVLRYDQHPCHEYGSWYVRGPAAEACSLSVT